MGTATCAAGRGSPPRQGAHGVSARERDAEEFMWDALLFRPYAADKRQLLYTRTLSCFTTRSFKWQGPGELSTVRPRRARGAAGIGGGAVGGGHVPRGSRHGLRAQPLLLAPGPGHTTNPSVGLSSGKGTRGGAASSRRLRRVKVCKPSAHSELSAGGRGSSCPTATVINRKASGAERTLSTRREGCRSRAPPRLPPRQSPRKPP